MSFADLGLNPIILKSLLKAGYTDPTPVQEQAIPAALRGTDLLVSAQTGSGKTAAFLLPSLCRLAEPAHVSGHGPRILVLTPTRELALQVEKASRTYGSEIRKLRTVSLVGGSPYAAQLKMLSQPVDVVVATPGRLIDHLERGRVDFARLEVLVLDEADRMLDMGFIDDIKGIVARTPATRQTLLFSATLDGTVGELAREMTREPQRIEVVSMEAGHSHIDQQLLFSDDHAHKARLLDHLLSDAEMQQVVVFTATKQGAEDLTESLRERGFPADALHGDMPQHKRNKTLQRMREGRTKVLVATDVAARGIDVAGISHVINFDAPRQAEDYVHRIGRTGRAGRSGTAVTLFHHREKHLLRNIERYTGQSIRVEVIAGLEPTARPERDSSGKSRRPRPEGGYRGKPGYGNGSGNKEFRPRPEGGFNRDRDGQRGADGRRDFDKPRSEQPRFDQPRFEQARSEQPRNERPRWDNDAQPARADEDAQPKTWKSRAELEYGERRNKPFNSQPRVRQGFEGRGEQRSGNSFGGQPPSYANKSYGKPAEAGPRRADDTRGPAKSGGEYKGQRDRKHADGFDKPKRNARYW